MLTKRIIPCLDVKDGVVVKGVKFRNHRVIGDVMELAQRYRDEGADELVFYDITASSDARVVDKDWIKQIARTLDIPFTVAGGIRSVEQARRILNYGADKISINSPALERPEFITELAEAFGTQCVVVGIDSKKEEDGHFVYLYTGDETKTVKSKRRTMEWAKEAQRLGAGEIVLNCMDTDGVRKGYDIAQLKELRDSVNIPIIASGGAGAVEDFAAVFRHAQVDGALAASVFHDSVIAIPDLKKRLIGEGLPIRPVQ
ncbi:MAG: imidazole glycerol phosphate synthase subunit HisF [Micavibrio aeruginosavorus]|uniref:Imidazole glycerol phosphate synthase subunit HisF n=1 Tax=Micavibrio aeruginosavorus TaxID=349221 RepID=A0A2W5BWN3_9BACT|nr:MAG: imidazole glycerol phosphate synthase subunit HisF [Micavibrio aeruginosavorus]